MPGLTTGIFTDRSLNVLAGNSSEITVFPGVRDSIKDDASSDKLLNSNENNSETLSSFSNQLAEIQRNGNDTRSDLGNGLPLSELTGDPQLIDEEENGEGNLDIEGLELVDLINFESKITSGFNSSVQSTNSINVDRTVSGSLDSSLSKVEPVVQASILQTQPTLQPSALNSLSMNLASGNGAVKLNNGHTNFGQKVNNIFVRQLIDRSGNPEGQFESSNLDLKTMINLKEASASQNLVANSKDVAQSFVDLNRTVNTNKTLSNPNLLDEINDQLLKKEELVDVTALKLDKKNRGKFSNVELLANNKEVQKNFPASLGKLATSLAKTESLQVSPANLNAGYNSATMSNEISPTNILPNNLMVSSANGSGLMSLTSEGSSASLMQQGLALRHDFSPNLAHRIQWMYQQALSSAEILMDPPELGPLSVKLRSHQGETSVIFQVTNSQTKEMIEDNLTKLKEMLEQQGISLGETQIEQRDNSQEESGENTNNSSSTSVEQETDDAPKIITQHLGILDIYA